MSLIVRAVCLRLIFGCCCCCCCCCLFVVGGGGGGGGVGVAHPLRGLRDTDPTSMSKEKGKGLRALEPVFPLVRSAPP